MFTFGFCEERETDSEKSNKTEEPSLQWLASKELYPTKSQWNRLNIIPKHKFETEDFTIHYVSAKDSIKILNKEKTEFIELAEQLHTDLLPSKYEGGLKIWECTYPLIEYLIKEEIEFKGKKVLDLGCGAGLLGIYVLLRGGLVSFQDYNSEVIESVTFPNILVNLPEKTMEELEGICRFFMGDWASFVEMYLKDVESEEDKYDVIMSSETIYNDHNHWKLLLALKKLLKRTGIAYIAAKTYYFGVGGSLRQFEKKLEDEGEMKASTCWKSSDGVIQEILQIEFKENASP